MALYLAFIIGAPILMMLFGLYKMLAWAKVVQTWNKTVGTVIAYYERKSIWDTSRRISTEEATRLIAALNLRGSHEYSTRSGTLFSAIIKYQYGHLMYEMVQDTRTAESLPYAPNEELVIYINPKNPMQVKLGDNITQLWLPFTIFMIGLALSIGILIWGSQHGWRVQ